MGIRQVRLDLAVRNWKMPIALLGMLVLAGWSLFVGVSNVTPWGLLTADGNQQMLFFVSRLPRLLAVLTAGAGMSVVGLIMQQLARNKFVSPSTSGVMESAMLGILVMLLVAPGWPILGKMAISFVFALAGALLFTEILKRAKFKDVIFVPLVGIMLGGIIGALTTFIAFRYNMLQSLGAYMYGGFQGVLRGRYELLYLTVPVVILTYLYADRFTVAGMGHDFATNLGLKYHQVVNLGLTLVALTTAAVVLTVGAIPFLGLVVPNVVSIMLGDNLRRTLPWTAFAGALFVLVCDILSRLIIFPYEIPISLIIGIIGSVTFLWLVLRRGVYAKA